MNTPELWIVILGFWVFVLQNKIKRLEEILGRLNVSQKTNSLSVKKVENIPASTEEQKVTV